jgi:hypothetical protein
MSEIGQSAYPVNKGKTHSNEGKYNTVYSSVDEDVHDFKNA